MKISAWFLCIVFSGMLMAGFVGSTNEPVYQVHHLTGECVSAYRFNTDGEKVHRPCPETMPTRFDVEYVDPDLGNEVRMNAFNRRVELALMEG